MISEKQNTKFSKFLSLVLRHQPELIGIDLDENGWTDIEMLLSKSKAHGVEMTAEILKHIVATNSKKRFAIDKDLNKIRANQGHSIDVDLGYSPKTPPAILFHGTSERSVASILAAGIEKRERHQVHLSADSDTAVSVGMRHGKPVVLKVLAGKMHESGFNFFLSENGVWLTDYVPAEFIEI
ncbi:MAG: RNA 2'-phosphotransferase [Chitinophagaceae bacterium]|nr:MAG: RNA 2'-phosphotransferase [Chitinophagaceae bacterium]